MSFKTVRLRSQPSVPVEVTIFGSRVFVDVGELILD